MVIVRVPGVALRFTRTDSVDVPEPVTDAGLNVVDNREPWPLALRLTVPVNPLTEPMLMLEVPVFPLLTVMLVGESEIVKSGCGAGFTIRLTVVECTRLPLVPVMVTVYVPAGVVVLVVTDMVDEPEPVTDVGLKLALAPAGNPLALRFTTPENPPDPVTVAVYEVPLPAVTVWEAGVAAIEKSPTTGAFTTSVTEAL